MDNLESKKYNFIAGECDNKKRLDVFLSSNIPYKSRSYFQKLIELKGVLVNDCTVNKNFKLKAGDIVKINNIELAEKHIELLPQNINLNIKYEDDYLIIISKDPGIVVHPAPGNYNNTIVNAVLFYLKNQLGLKNSLEENFEDLLRPGIVHRLDKDTSGLMIIAKNSNIQRKLSGYFKERKVFKAYKALVLGNFEESKGKISLPLGRSRINRKQITVLPDMGKQAETEFEVVKSFKDLTLLNVFPKSGRTHQIRVHFSFIGHPIIGDKIYGNKKTEQLANFLELKRQFLHSYFLSFNHPVTNKKIQIIDELAFDLQNALDKIK